MGDREERKGESKKRWETPRVISVERIPEVLGSCNFGTTVRGQAKTCTLGSSARGRCSLGTSVVPL